MSGKILSGILMPVSGNRRSGSAIIDLQTGALLPGADASFNELRINGSGAFTSKPATLVSLRQTRSKDVDVYLLLPSDFREIVNDFNLSDEIRRDGPFFRFYSVSWSCSLGCSIREISVLVCGHTTTGPLG